MNKYKICKHYVQVTIESKQFGVILFKVDHDSWDKIKNYNWSVAERKTVSTRFYMQNRELGLLHRFLMNNPKGFCVDHINRNTLDNRLENLRVCTYSENLSNKAGYGRCKYKYMSISTRHDRKNPRTLYTIKFPDCKCRQISNKSNAYAYYIECLMKTKRKTY